jgi:hypothetical protein
MIYLPGACERCRSIALIASSDSLDGRALCGYCGGIVNIFGGTAYPEGDVLLFNELLTRLEASFIAGLEAEQLANAIDSARSTFDEPRALGLMTSRVPTLEPLEPLLAVSMERTRQALSMLETILRALARQRRSGIVSSRPTEAQRPAGSAGNQGAMPWKEEEPLASIGAHASSKRERRG